MSLINQMLQDLDKRRYAANEGGVLLREVPVARTRGQSRLLVPVALAACAACAASALLWGLSQRAPSAAPLHTAPGAVLPPSVQRSEEPSSARPQHAPLEPALVTVLPQPRELAQDPTAKVLAIESRRRVPRPDDDAASLERIPSPVLAAIGPERQPQGSTRAGNERGLQQPRRNDAQQQPMNAQQPSDAPPRSDIDKRTRELTAQQLAENDYRAGATLLNNGRTADAGERFRAALQHHPAHVGARQALFGLLLNAQSLGEAEKVLHDGLKVNARQPGFAMALARLQIDRGDAAGALETLQRAAPAASGSADYLAFLAAVLQRHERHAEAAEHFQAALALAPSSGVWQMGLGISLQALNRNAEAVETFRRAKAGAALNAELRAFVDERLRELQRR